MQDDIAGEVVKALKLTLLGTNSVTRSRPVDPEAYNLALQGRFFTGVGKTNLERAVDYFQRSRERDPDYAPAWAGLSQAYAQQADNGYAPAADGYDKRARPRKRRWRSIPSSLTRTWRWAGFTRLRLGLGGRGRQFRQALALEPGSARHSGTPAVWRGTSDTVAKQSNG